MVSLCGRFERDILFLEQGECPKQESGKEITALEYSGEKFEKLTDSDVQRFSNAICGNSKFQGTLNLAGNGLSDLAALYLAKALEKIDFFNITKLDLSDNSFSSKAGEYIGCALSQNPEYTIFKVGFSRTNLTMTGLVRMVEAVNQNKNVLLLDIGIVCNDGLTKLAELLKDNSSLEEIAIEETSNHQKYWNDAGMSAFTTMLKNCT